MAGTHTDSQWEAEERDWALRPEATRVEKEDKRKMYKYVCIYLLNLFVLNYDSGNS